MKRKEEKLESGEEKVDIVEEERQEEFLEFLRNIEFPAPPLSIEKNLMANYKKYYRYKIFWRNIKTKLEEWKTSFHVGAGRKIAIASAGFLFIICVGIYYQYGKVEPGNIALQQQVVPTPHSTTSDTTKNTSNDNENVSNQNNVGIKESNKVKEIKNKPPNDKTLQEEKDLKDKVVSTLDIKKETSLEEISKQPRNSVVRSSEDVENNKIVGKLSEIDKIYVYLTNSSEVDEIQKERLEKLCGLLKEKLPTIKGKYQWQVVSENEAAVALQVDWKRQNVFIVNLEQKDLWVMHLTNLEESPEFVADKVIKQLQKDISHQIN